MRCNFAAQFVKLPVRRQRLCGLIADRQSIPTTTAASGKSFISVTVAIHGGRGAAIDPHLSCIVQSVRPIQLIRHSVKCYGCYSQGEEPWYGCNDILLLCNAGS